MTRFWTYFRLIYALRQYPNTEDFVYLKRVDRNFFDYNPYALKVVPFGMLDQTDFCTLSARGVSRYMDNMQTDFTSLDQWEREVQLFYALKSLKIFEMYRMWKGFRFDWCRRTSRWAPLQILGDKKIERNMGTVHTMRVQLSCLPFHA